MTSDCKNCGALVDTNFCPHCGQKASTERFTIKSLLHEFIHGFYHVDHGILYTIKALTVYPAEMIKEYLHGKRKTYFNPFTFVLIIAGVLTIFLPKLIQESLFAELGWSDHNLMNESLQQSSFENLSIRIILGLPVLAFITNLFYRKKEFSFSENLITNTYLRGQSQIFLLVLLPLLVVHPSRIMMLLFSLVYYFIVLIYSAWVYCSLFENKISFTGILKGFACAVTGNLAEFLIANLLFTAATKIFIIHF